MYRKHPLARQSRILFSMMGIRESLWIFQCLCLLNKQLSAKRNLNTDITSVPPTQTFFQATQLIHEFQTFIQQRNSTGWENWLERDCSENAPIDIRRFGKCLKQDEWAVRAEMESKWSNGQVEGQVNRLIIKSAEKPALHANLHIYTKKVKNLFLCI